ncbi:MAG: class I mannose-6-phosphate isomerase [Bacteroidales bacterium]
MSFMFNPHPYDDPTAINRPKLSAEVINSIVSGTTEAATHLTNAIVKKLESGNVIMALDGYTGARFDQTINLLSQNLKLKSIDVKTFDFKNVLKSSSQLDEDFLENLKEDKEKDPVLLYGKLFKGGYEDLFDAEKLAQFETSIKESKTGSSNQVFIVYGFGCTLKMLRSYYDIVCYFDVTPKEVILRAKKGMFANLGDLIARPIKTMLRRCYYIDFEVAGHLRWELIENNAIDYYIASNDLNKLQLIPKESFSSITSALAKCPLRCKPVYIEGVWGGHYIKKLRNLPDTMVNAAWVFDLIPLEVSVVVEAGKQLLEFPFFTFVQKEGEALMGADCVKKFGGYFPIRFNYDDSYHSSGNMSIQVHSGHKYNVENYGEHGRQDESYYIVATGHGAKTYVGFNEDADPNEFISLVKKSEKDFTPVDYQKYVSHIKSIPGTQVMLPAGTIHSSGRNQVILEIGSLTIGSYTYKMYDYLRADFDGKPRPIHTYHGENVLSKERTTSWVKENLVQEARLVKSGNGWAEYIVGEHDLLYFSLRRLEFEKEIEGNTEGKFHVLTLVDGEKVLVQSLDNPELSYTQNYLDVVVVPANMGRYVVKNLGNQPVCMHKTMLKDGFTNDGVLNN